MPEKELDYEYPNMLKFVLAREGGYVNDKDDPGGETNKGITHTTYNSYRRSKGFQITREPAVRNILANKL